MIASLAGYLKSSWSMECFGRVVWVPDKDYLFCHSLKYACRPQRTLTITFWIENLKFCLRNMTSALSICDEVQLAISNEQLAQSHWNEIWKKKIWITKLSSDKTDCQLYDIYNLRWDRDGHVDFVPIGWLNVT